MRFVALHIAQPCQESWAAMTPTNSGRHCAACAAEVVDFTLKTDAEILAYLAKAAGRRTCGRFAAGQLERPLQRAAPATPTTRWRAWLAAAAAVWGLREATGSESKAQAPIEMQRKMGKPVLVAEHLRTVRKPDLKGQRASYILRGIVRDSATHDGLPGVTVLIKKSTLGTATNHDGLFELSVPPEYASAGAIELKVSSVGYVSEDRRIALDAEARELTFLLRPDVKGLLEGELIVVGGYSASFRHRPWPWHPRRFYYWSKYWLTRPFRRS